MVRTAIIASIAGCYECIEPMVSNLCKLSGDFLQVNRYLIEELKQLGCPKTLRTIYRTVWGIPMRSLIDMAAARGANIDQSASLNLFMESPNIGQLSSMYMYAWKAGLKTRQRWPFLPSAFQPRRMMRRVRWLARWRIRNIARCASERPSPRLTMPTPQYCMGEPRARLPRHPGESRDPATWLPLAVPIRVQASPQDPTSRDCCPPPASTSRLCASA